MGHRVRLARLTVSSSAVSFIKPPITRHGGPSFGTRHGANFHIGKDVLCSACGSHASTQRWPSEPRPHARPGRFRACSNLVACVVQSVSFFGGCFGCIPSVAFTDHLPADDAAIAHTPHTTADTRAPTATATTTTTTATVTALCTDSTHGRCGGEPMLPARPPVPMMHSLFRLRPNPPPRACTASRSTPPLSFYPVAAATSALSSLKPSRECVLFAFCLTCFHYGRLTFIF
jgi:hypothetical protein